MLSLRLTFAPASTSILTFSGKQAAAAAKRGDLSSVSDLRQIRVASLSVKDPGDEGSRRHLHAMLSVQKKRAEKDPLVLFRQPQLSLPVPV